MHASHFTKYLIKPYMIYRTLTEPKRFDVLSHQESGDKAPRPTKSCKGSSDMANELGTIIENRLRDKGWSVSGFTLESGVSAEVLANLIGPEQLPSMPEEATLVRLSEALDLPYRQLVVAAAVACGLPKNQEGERAFVLRYATNE